MKFYEQTVAYISGQSGTEYEYTNYYYISGQRGTSISLGAGNDEPRPSLSAVLFQGVAQRLGPYVANIHHPDKVALRADKLGVKVSHLRVRRSGQRLRAEFRAVFFFLVHLFMPSVHHAADLSEVHGVGCRQQRTRRLLVVETISTGWKPRLLCRHCFMRLTPAALYVPTGAGLIEIWELCFRTKSTSTHRLKPLEQLWVINQSSSIVFVDKVRGNSALVFFWLW